VSGNPGEDDWDGNVEQGCYFICAVVFPAKSQQLNVGEKIVSPKNTS
jgi:hypothetical protein